MLRTGLGLVALLVVLAAASAAAADGPGSSHHGRYRFCMAGSSGCGHRFVGGDLPAARFEDRSGRRPRVRVCVRDRRGTRCLRARRPGRSGVLAQSIAYRMVGPHVTTWRVRGEVVGRWRWRVVPEPE
jgi:hypothetical protein